MDKDYKLLITDGHVTGHRTKYVFGRRMGIPAIISWISGGLLCASALVSPIQDGLQAPNFLNNWLRADYTSSYWKEKPKPVVNPEPAKVAQDSVTNHENINQPVSEARTAPVQSVQTAPIPEKSMLISRYNMIRTSVEFDLGGIGNTNFPMAKAGGTQIVNNLKNAVPGWGENGIIIRRGNAFGVLAKVNGEIVASEFLKQGSTVKCYTMAGPTSPMCNSLRPEDAKNFIN